MIRCVSPIDGSIFAERPTLSAEAATAAVARANAAQPEWAARPLQERIALVQAGDLVALVVEELVGEAVLTDPLISRVFVPPPPHHSPPPEVDRKAAGPRAALFCSRRLDCAWWQMRLNERGDAKR